MTTSPLFNSLIHLLVIALIFWVLWWGLGKIGIPEPFNKVIRVVLAIAAVIVVCNFLLGMIGHGFIHWTAP